MLFAVMGFFKPGIETLPAKLEADLNEHLSQPFISLKLAGPLKNRLGKSVGLMVCLEVADFDKAEAYLSESPFTKNDMYERVEVVEYSLEVGKL